MIYLLFLAVSFFTVNAFPTASVTIDGVEFQGFQRNTGGFHSNVFYGIKYADAPRMRDPILRPPSSFTTPYVAQAPGAMCMQTCATLPQYSCIPSLQTSEDCLFLNIFSPLTATQGSDLPVVFFMHGGNFIEGTGAAPLYESDRLVEIGGVIVVTINYRLGIFGYLGSGNFGLKDQIAALEWVSTYISNFGGDPSKITVMGQSAGAMSVGLLLTHAASSARIHNTIFVSSPFSLRYRTPEQGDFQEANFAAQVGCDVGDLNCYDGVDAQVILAQQFNPAVANYDNELLSSFMRWGPVIDDDLVKDHAYNLFKNKLTADKDTMIGTVRDEGVGYVATGPDPGNFEFLLGALLQVDPVLLVNVLLYPIQTDTRFTLAEMATDFIFRCVGREVGRFIIPSKRVYRYEFNDVLPEPVFGNACDQYSCHGGDLPYHFGSFRFVSDFDFSNNQKDLSDALITSITRFAKGMTPTRTNYPFWFRNRIWAEERESSSRTHVFTASSRYNSYGFYFLETVRCDAMTAATYNPTYTP